ncbi:MAG: uncharacterized protein FD167_1013, partial [bacterium]
MKTQRTTLRYIALLSAVFSLVVILLLPGVSAQSPQEPNKEKTEQKQNNQRIIPEIYLSDPPPPETPQSDKDSIPTIKLNTNLVTFNITVTDPYGRYVTGLSKEHFEVYDDKIPQKIEHFTDEDAPTSVGIIFDISGSMKGRLARSFEALNKFCDTSHQLDEYFLVTFNNNAKLAQDFTSDSRNV